jgi:hypothetical protein
MDEKVLRIQNPIRVNTKGREKAEPILLSSRFKTLQAMASIQRNELFIKFLWLLRVSFQKVVVI